jgi:hypothetical protein
MKHWHKKERFQSVGVDPNEMVLLARRLEQDQWSLQGPWLRKWECTKAFEFDFQLCLAEMTHAIIEEGVDELEAKATTLEAARKAFQELNWQTSAANETWSILEERVDARLAEVTLPAFGSKSHQI